MQSQLDDAVFKLPGERFAFELIRLHLSNSNHAFEGQDALETAAGSLGASLHDACLTAYISSISFCKRAAIRSRLSLPLAVSNPFSMEKGSG